MKQVNLDQFLRFFGGTLFVALVGSCGGSALASDCADPKSAANPLFDANDRIIATCDADGGRSTNSYDKAGRLVARADAKGVITRIQYDANGNRIMDTMAPASTVTKK